MHLPITEESRLITPRHMSEPSLSRRSIGQTTLTIHQLAESLGCAIDFKDHYTRNHSRDVAAHASAIARGMGLEENWCEMIDIAAHLHDIGKIGISDAVLKNRGRLSDEQWLEMRQHPLLGYEILKDINVLNHYGGVADMVLYHHERWDGSGYPEGLYKEEIPLGARILAIADSFSAMVDDRRYRRGIGPEEAMAEIIGASGRLYDPQLVTVFQGIGKDRTLPHIFLRRSPCTGI